MPYLKRRSAYYLLATAVTAGLFFSLTNPSKVGSPWLIVGFLLAAATIYWVAQGVAILLGLYSKTLRQQRHRLVRTFTVLGSLLIALQSIGQLSFRDLAVLVPLVVIAYLYLSYARPGHERA